MCSERRNALISALHIIERYALNDEGIVGSLYDARADNILSNLPINQDFITRTDVNASPTCHLEKVDNSFDDNLLKMIDIEDELRVSVLLGMTSVNKGTLLFDTYGLFGDHKVRFIYYNHVTQEESLSPDLPLDRKTISDSLLSTNATHIITSVRQGIDFVILLELPETTNHSEIDFVLKKLCNYFTKYDAVFLSTEEEQKINGLKPIIFTQIDEIRSLTDTKNLSDICQSIHRIIFGHKHNVPLSYTLHTLKCIYHDNPYRATESCKKLDPWILDNIERKIVPLYNKLKRIEHFFNDKISPQLSEYLKIDTKEAQEKVSRVKIMYKDIQQSLVTKVYERRQGNLQLLLAEEELNSAQFQSLDSELEALHATLVKLQTKASFITKLKTDHQMEYLNVTNLEDTNDVQKTLKSKLISFAQEYSRCYLCASDELVEKNLDKFEKLCQQLIELRQTNSLLCLVFADFTDCSYKLNAMEILQPPISASAASYAIQSDEINILLIGETGVGKSTFINAFINYLAFHSFKDAENGDPVVLIPISFPITIGDQFEEKKIEFGQFDSNEDHNQSGQSVTQHCKSYIFTIGNNIKLRIIDTPGIGDTRGAEQDNKNIENILLYTNNLSHLNAICFLLKPNTARLHALFRSCFTQLFNFLGPNARENIIFCFTNTRATFYTPGDTVTSLKEMLNRLPNDQIPSFAKKNTFCFDSESFRYLAIIKAGHELPFDDGDKLNFEKSWEISVTESIRLLDYIESRPRYEMNKWHSMKHAQMMITLMIQPILETICNALRNLALWDVGNKQHIIELKAQPIPLPARLCTVCSYETTQIENISIITHSIHYSRTSNECATCHRVLDKHLPVFYNLEYHLGGTKGTRFSSETEMTKNRLHYGSLLMTQFLLHTAGISKNPFLPWFDLFIREQEYLSSKEPRSAFSIKLCNKLNEEKQKYVNGLKDVEYDDERIQLDAIYNCIDEVLAYPLISEQMNAIRKSQMEMMKNYEYDVSSQYPHIDMAGLPRRLTTTTNH